MLGDLMQSAGEVPAVDDIAFSAGLACEFLFSCFAIWVFHSLLETLLFLMATSAPLGCSWAGTVLYGDPVQLPAGSASLYAAGVHLLLSWAFDIHPDKPPRSSRSSGPALSRRLGLILDHFLPSLYSIAAASASVSYQNPSVILAFGHPDEPPADSVSLCAAGGSSFLGIVSGSSFCKGFTGVDGNPAQSPWSSRSSCTVTAWAGTSFSVEFDVT